MLSTTSLSPKDHFYNSAIELRPPDASSVNTRTTTPNPRQARRQPDTITRATNMTKGKSKSSRGTNKASNSSSGYAPTSKSIRTISGLRQDKDLWYKTCVLVYDLRNMAKEKTSENRTLQTMDKLYISAPYFSADEAATIKAIIVENGDSTESTLEQAITNALQNFFEKRRASGDCRPCGPHDMAPVYLACFGIDKTELEDEKFVSRLRRSGLRTA